MRIIISGPAAAFDADGNEITSVRDLKRVDGLTYDEDVCSNYFYGALDEIGIEGGALRIAYDSRSKRLRVVTEYRSPRELKKSELQALLKETQGQWSDGIGEGCFGYYFDESGVSIDPYPIGYEDAGVTIEQIDDGVRTPRKRYSLLFKAAEAGDTARLSALLDKGEDINSRNKHDQTPLMWSILHGQTDAALLLIERGADVNLRSKDGASAIKAAINGDLKVLRRLIDAGADVNMRDDRGATPAMWAANRGDVDCLKALIEAGCDLNLQDTMEYNEGHTALMYATPARLDVVELLLTHGADPNIRNKAGHTASEEALFQAEALARHGAGSPAAWRKKAAFLQQHEA
jgi:uncharacterized protein